MTPFWHGFLFATFLWLCVLTLSRWYWRRKIEELRVLFKQISELHQQAIDGEGT